MQHSGKLIGVSLLLRILYKTGLFTFTDESDIMRLISKSRKAFSREDADDLIKINIPGEENLPFSLYTEPTKPKKIKIPGWLGILLPYKDFLAAQVFNYVSNQDPKNNSEKDEKLVDSILKEVTRIKKDKNSGS